MVTQRLVSQVPPPQAGVQAPRMTPFDTSAFENTMQGSIDTVRAEIDDAFEDMKTFHNLEPDEIMRMAGGHSARLSELRMRCERIEDYKREWKNIRTREIEPTIAELANQYAIASRLHSVRELDWKMESGER